MLQSMYVLSFLLNDAKALVKLTIYHFYSKNYYSLNPFLYCANQRYAWQKVVNPFLISN